METEIENLFKVWLSVYASVSICYLIIRKIPQGGMRLVALLPVISLFTLLPLNLSSIHFGGITALLITWLANFKLILFAFNQGPLSSNPPLPFLHFVSIACLPINIIKHDDHPFSQTTKPPLNSPCNYFIKFILLAFCIFIYNYKQYFNQIVVVALFWSYLYLVLEILFALVAFPVQAMLHIKIQAQFQEPYLSTSLHNFWSQRWNLMVPSILRPAIYCPIQCFVTNIFGNKYTLIPAMLGAFLVSGLMHELIFFYITNVRPTWEVTFFFFLHGVCTVLEIQAKKALIGKWQLHPLISRPLVLGFIGVTAFWLCLPQLIRNGVMEKIVEEYSLVIELVMNVIRP